MKKSGFMDGAIIAIMAIFVTKFLGIIYAIPFNSIVGDAGGALYGYAYTIYVVFLIISSAGIPMAISKLTSEYNELGKNNEKEYLYQVTKKIILGFSIISFLICFLGAPLIAKLIIGNMVGGNTIEDVTFVIRCVSFSVLVVPLLSINRGYLQGHGYISASSFSEIIEQLARISVILLGSFYVLNILHLSLKTAIGVAVFGSCIGGLIAYFYLSNRIWKIKKKNDKVSLEGNVKKEIIQKLIIYAIPFIIINIANSLYNATDMILLNRGLNMLHLEATQIEAINSVFTTWGGKLQTIITSIATGMAISLVPNIAKNNASKDIKGINNKFNQTIQIFFYIALPLAIFMSIFNKQIWQIFFGSTNIYGPIIIRYSLIVAAFDALYIMICNGLQGLNKTKLIYTSVLLGLGINLALDIPLILLFNKLNLYPYYGAITATLIGYIISLTIPLISLKRNLHLNYHNTIIKIPKLFVSYVIMICLSLVTCDIIKSVNNRLLLVPIIGVIGIIFIIIYYIINQKELQELFGNSLSKIFKRRINK